MFNLFDKSTTTSMNHQRSGRHGLPQGRVTRGSFRAGHRPTVQRARPLDSFLHEPPPTAYISDLMKFGRPLREFKVVDADDVKRKLSPILRHTDFPPNFVRDTLAPSMPSENAAILMAGVLLAAAKRRGTGEIGDLWRKSELKWNQFLPSYIGVEGFIEKHKLEFTVPPSVAAAPKINPLLVLKPLLSPNEPEIPAEIVTLNLKRLLTANRSNGDIIDFINDRRYRKQGHEANFIKILVSQVIENSLEMIHSDMRPFDLNPTKLKARVPLLAHYIGHNENLELEALKAVQSVICSTKEYGLFRPILDILYDDDIVTEESLDSWRSGNILGKTNDQRKAFTWTEPFFEWLRKVDTSSDEYEYVYDDYY